MKSCFFLLLCAFAVPGQGQTTLLPGDGVLKKREPLSGRFEMAYCAVSGGTKTEVGTFSFDLSTEKDRYCIYTNLTFSNGAGGWKDTCITDRASFAPVYHSSFNSDREYMMKFGKTVSGFYYDKASKKKVVVNEAVPGAFFDSHTYPYLLGLLPLESGYSTEMPVFDFKPGINTPVSMTRVEEVKNSLYTSPLSGDHKVWQVSVFEEYTRDRYKYFIDKLSGRIWKIEIVSGRQELLLLDKETDADPFKTKFDYDATQQLILSGHAVISGQVFARDNQNEGLLKGMAVLNVNKKQYARSGTNVLLIPYTEYFKEWIKLNESSRKNGRSIPLPAQAAACIKVATVYDNEGHFEFVNLMPGEYLLYTEFGYVHSGIRSEVVGYTDVYINGLFQGSTPQTSSYSYRTNAAAAIKKTVTIKKDGDKETVKLKKTL